MCYTHVYTCIPSLVDLSRGTPPGGNTATAPGGGALGAAEQVCSGTSDTNMTDVQFRVQYLKPGTCIYNMSYNIHVYLVSSSVQVYI